MLVPVLVHVDLNNRNIMVKDGTVSGILDWEIHSSLPACLGATYPDFMRYDAAYHPKYGTETRLMPTKECWPSEDEAATLRNILREAAGLLSADFVRALEKGEILRQLLELVSCWGLWSFSRKWLLNLRFTRTPRPGPPLQPATDPDADPTLTPAPDMDDSEGHNRSTSAGVAE
ncbi:hypothetical protein BU17DRAFT_88752 [Hysterangium stoloniferum]|nr:hypothetical protein BU17DRAFT_88752 [Hysterangium stoloniferum]